MLKEIRCSFFKEKIINFHEGLNTIMGDAQASNSIGKSTMLMIIDYIYGGNSYLEHNKDVIDELGHHEFEFIFIFDEKKYYFKRGTLDSKTVQRCYSDFTLSESISTLSFTAFLKEKYKITPTNLTLRSVISLYSRVWGKHNLDVKRPLHTYPKEKNESTVNRLLSLFNEYEQVIEHEKNLKRIQSSEKALKSALKMEHIPKINKTTYEKNSKRLKIILNKIEEIKKNVIDTTINISKEISNKAYNLEQVKKEYLKERTYYKNRENRIQKNLMESKSISQNFDKLTAFFPEVNIKKLEDIDNFHNQLKHILKQELLTAQKEIKNNLTVIDSQINEIDLSIKQLLNVDNQPSHLIQELLDLSNDQRILETENKYYEKQEELKKNIVNASKTLNDKKNNSLKNVSIKINHSIETINDQIHTNSKRRPELLLYENDYEYNFFDNTGTGKAYSNLILLDLSILSSSDLPILIHDSILFKNVENLVVERIISLYKVHKKQIFIAIDETQKYEKTTQQILNQTQVLQLTKDKTLFTKNWGRK